MTEINKYIDFKTALRQFVEEVCINLKTTGIPVRRWVRIIRNEKGTSFPEEERTDYWGISFLLIKKYYNNPPDSMRKILDIAQKNPELANVLLVDAAGVPIHEEKTQLWWIFNFVLIKFINAYLKEANTIIFDEIAFNKISEKLLKYINTPNIVVKELSPLTNASLDCESIKIASHLVIRKLSTEELEDFYNNYMIYPYNSMLGHISTDVTQLECAIETTYEKKRHEVRGVNTEIIDSVRDLVTTLRLHTDQNVGIAYTLYNSDDFLQSGGNMSFSPRLHIFGQKAQINATNQQAIIEIWNHIRALSSKNPIKLALRRWNYVFERFDVDDALVDYWIAFESLFTPDSSQEVRYRASFRIAAFIEDKPEQRHTVYKDMQDSYDLRSRIVHGGVPENKRKTDLINITRSYLRKALLKILPFENTFDPKEIEIAQLKK